jgi:hypothetical protein
MTTRNIRPAAMVFELVAGEVVVRPSWERISRTCWSGCREFFGWLPLPPRSRRISGPIPGARLAAAPLQPLPRCLAAVELAWLARNHGIAIEITARAEGDDAAP